MSAVTLVVHNQRPNAAELARQATQWLQERGHEVRMPEADAEAVEAAGLSRFRTRSSRMTSSSRSASAATARCCAPSTWSRRQRCPVLGVNVGHLGYLTEVEPNAMTIALERFFAGDYGIEDRMMLSVTIRSKRSILDGWSFRALNEAVVEKTQSGHTVRMLVSIGGECSRPTRPTG